MVKKIPSENKVFQMLLENIQGGVVYSDYDPPFHLRYVSAGMTQLSGYSQEELLSKGQMDLVHPDDVEFLAAEVTKQFAHSDTFSVEYRLLRKDGSFLHVLDRAKMAIHSDGKRYIHCLLTDITYIKRMEQAVHLNEEKYKLTLQQSGNVIIEYKPEQDRILFSDNYTDVLGEGFGPFDTFEAYIQNGIIDENVFSEFIAALPQFLSNHKSYQKEFQITNAKGKQIWCQIYLTPLIQPHGQAFAIIGCVRNINEQKKRVEKLTKLSSTDPLTGILNRTVMEKNVNEQLQIAHCGALLILDIDYFKLVNDRHGHSFGDEILLSVVTTIKPLLPETALFGRLGGDEFLVFLPGEAAETESIALAGLVVQTIETHFAHAVFPVTISAGLAFSQIGLFYNLYKNADLALYRAKEKGRNRFEVFLQETAFFNGMSQRENHKSTLSL